MARILFVRETMLDHGVQLSTNHLCRAAAALGHDVLWLTRPVTPLTVVNTLRSADARRRVALAASSLAGRSATQFAFFTPVMRKKQLGMTGDALLDNMVRFALPPLKQALSARAWPDVDLLWFSDPQLARIVDRVPHRRLAFQVTDDYTQFVNYDADMERALRHVLASADAVFFTNRALLQDYVARFGLPPARCTYIGHGVAAFRGREGEPPRDSIRAAYIGAVNDWLDWSALENLTRRLPQLRIDVFGHAGPAMRRKAEAFARFLGPLSSDRVPETLAGYHFGLIPFRRTELKAFSEPMKLYDYIAAGLPVLSFIDLDPELRARFPDGIEVASGIDAAASYLSRSGSDYAELKRNHLRAAAQFAAENSWARRFASAFDFVTNARETVREGRAVEACA
jgi:hypothetical protein